MQASTRRRVGIQTAHSRDDNRSQSPKSRTRTARQLWSLKYHIHRISNVHVPLLLRIVTKQASTVVAVCGMKKLWQFYTANDKYDGRDVELQSLVGRPSPSDGDQEEPAYSIRKPTAALRGEGSRGFRNVRKGLMHARAEAKFQQLSAAYKSREELQEDVELPHWVVHPLDIRAQFWWTFIICTVVATLFVEPYNLAFSQYPGLYPLTSPDTLFSVFYTLIYVSDVMLNFFVAYYENGALVTDLRKIARHYTRGSLWADVVTTIPFDWIVLQAMGLQTSDSITAWYISLLRLLKLGRAYRLYTWLQLMTYKQTISLLVVTLTRNFALCFFTVHWGACGFYYIAKQSGFSDQSWVGANMDWVGKGTSFDQWIYSMYWSIITFSTVGYGDLHAYSVAEAAFVVVFMFVSIGVSAYFVGTSVLLVAENEKKTGAYRESLIVLDDYSSTHDIPESMKEELKGHLQLHFSSAETNDEAVLAVYPTTIRRRILRHLYNQPMRTCWLFSGCKQKFLDALLATAKVELFMPKVDIVSAGDQVNELLLIVAGEAAAEGAAAATCCLAEDGLMLSVDDGVAARTSSTRLLHPGDPVGEMAFFTETPCLESIRTTGLCRVLVIPRALYSALITDFPLSSRAVMDNLLARAEQMVADELPTNIAANADDMAALELRYATAELEEHSIVNRADGIPHSKNGSLPAVGSVWGQRLRMDQQQLLSNLLRVRALVKATRARLEQQRTHEFLNACSVGSLEHIRTLLQQGRDINCCDYDGRTGLMLAASKGRSSAVSLLLRAGADVNAKDLLGSSALLEAARSGHDETLRVLLSAGAKLQLTEVQHASLLCSAVSEGDVQLLRHLLQAGADANAADYDKRRPLHIAAADGNLPVVRLLVEVGRADPALLDRWQQTPLQEAQRTGASPVIHYLASKAAPGASLSGLSSINKVIKPQQQQEQQQEQQPEHSVLSQQQQLLQLQQQLQGQVGLQGQQDKLAVVAQLLEQQVNLVKMLIAQASPQPGCQKEGASL